MAIDELKEIAAYLEERQKLSVEGLTMTECRANLIDWLNNAQRDKWANHCMNHWLRELGGLAAVW